METTAVKKTTTTKAPKPEVTTYAQVYQELSFFASIADQDTAWGLNGVWEDIAPYALSAMPVTKYKINTSLAHFINANEDVVSEEIADKVFDDVARIIDYIFAKWAR